MMNRNYSDSNLPSAAKMKVRVGTSIRKISQPLTDRLNVAVIIHSQWEGQRILVRWE